MGKYEGHNTCKKLNITIAKLPSVERVGTESKLFPKVQNGGLLDILREAVKFYLADLSQFC